MAVALAAGFAVLAICMLLFRSTPPVFPRTIGGSSFVIFGVNAWWWPASASIMCLGIAWSTFRVTARWKGALLGLAVLVLGVFWFAGFSGGRRTGETWYFGRVSAPSGVGSIYNVGVGNLTHGLPPEPPGKPRVWWHHYDTVVQMRLDWMYSAGMMLGALLLVAGVVVCWRLELVYTPPNMCENCRYDLRGIESERCPECGLVRTNETAHT